MKKRFCDNCLKEVNGKYKEEMVTEIIDKQKITYLKKYYICDECNKIFYDDLLDYNIKSANNELREITNLITIDEINEILEKYNIGKKPASYVLGLGEVTLTRYLDGQNPSKENSDFLKEILNNPNLYELYLITNKDKITDLAFKKSLGKTNQLELTTEHSKLYNVALYVINKLEETTPLALQKILYFVEGFSNKILKENLFDDSPEAWVHGPVYREIYDCFSYYKYNNINYSEILKDYEFDLTESEKEYLDKMILMFGCYSGKVLREMTHLTKPWIETRNGLEPDETSERIIEKDIMLKYFSEMCDKYDINSVDDIENYSVSVFHEAINKISENN